MPEEPSNVTQTEPVVQTQQPTPPFGEKKKSKKGLIIGIIVATFVVLLAGGGAWAYMWYQSPEKVVEDSAIALTVAENIQTKTEITSDSELMEGAMNLKLKKITLDANGTEDMKGAMKLSAILELNGRDYPVSGQGILDMGAKQLHFRIDDVKDTIDKVLNTFGSGQIALSEPAVAKIKMLENKWVKVTIDEKNDDMKELSCILDTTKKYQSDKAKADQVIKEMKETYKKHPFVKITKELGTKDGLRGYEVKMDKDATKAYFDELKNTEYDKEIAKCYDSKKTNTDDIQEKIAADSTKATLSIWISEWSHEIKKAEYTVKTKNETTGKDVEFKGQTDFAYKKDVKIDAPSDAMEFKEWQKGMEDLMKMVTDQSAFKLVTPATNTQGSL